MFKKIFRIGTGIISLATKLLPQTVIISIVSEVAAVALEALVKYSKKKESSKALDKIGKKALFIAEALTNHSDSDFDNKLLQQIKDKI